MLILGLAVIITYEMRFNSIKKTEVIRSTLAQAYGTSQKWKIYPDLLITDGVKLMTEMRNAYWLLQDAFI